MDETSFSKDPEKTKTVGAEGHASTRVIASPGRDNTTVLLCGNARGEKAPPMIIYKGKNVWDSWVSPDAYPNTSYAATDNGWMESEIFEQYFIKTFLPTIGNQRPILLIYDGHATHVGLNIIMKAREAGVTILKLPAHTSHVLQPLDVAVMKSFKDKWDSLLVKEQRLNVGVPLPKAKFAQLIGEVWKEIDGQVLKSGFRKTGIFPYNVDEIAEKNFDSLKLQRWRQHLATTASGNSVTAATKNSETIVAKTPKSLLVLALDIATSLYLKNQKKLHQK
ncbi:jg21237 [Pararge aegeria aegeria]|uniref:Jg21237 protein n=1 Tax=Pararge aegeria aegeria TaxID=348720 RepID=A0A8S4QZX7_9NEOP|nr:jg21237 [Pararge aegeria aegeria]